ncbi:Aquaporin-12 [Bagarius yarrelli]|uniref:Aquaporin n=1 Tax=Bagarius yarrelli TaxID=175774 RepID=A0A556TS91_BAGYA|nr:Aquaporin-12 [Bagarius yarrelli]
MHEKLKGGEISDKKLACLNITLGYFVSVVVGCGFAKALVTQWKPKWSFLSEFIAAFALAACRLEVQTISEIGQWAGGLGQDVTLTMLFLALTVHGVIMQGVTGNPSVTLMEYLQKETGAVASSISIVSQLGGAQLALLFAGRYWAMELTDMHMIKVMMMTQCSSSLNVPLIQGTITEVVSALFFHMVDLSLRRRSQLLRIPILALLLTFLYYTGNAYTSAYANPSLAYALTFNCPGHTFWEYAVVYWLGPLIGMTLALFLYMGNIPLLFTKNLLFSKKARLRLPKRKTAEEKSS